ncbi:hypothetical protein HCH35_26415 [Klebsiella michiganensis]|nr:hypothetical protein [Klebsiella michiganensis]
MKTYIINDSEVSRLSVAIHATVSGYVPAAAGWYLREQNNAGKNVYHPVMA